MLQSKWRSNKNFCFSFFFLTPDYEYQIIQESLNLAESASGGDEGYDETFNIGLTTTQDNDLSLYFNAYGNVNGDFWDNLIVTCNIGTIWDTGCVMGEHSTTATLPAGAEWVRVQVLVNCNNPSTGTAWDWTLNLA